MSGLISITTPAISTQLTTVAAVTDALGVTPSNASALIDRASAQIAEFTGTLGKQTITETFRAEHIYGVNYFNGLSYWYGYNRAHTIRPLLLTYTPILSIASITEDTTSLVALTDYEWEISSGMVWRLSSDTRVPWAGSKTMVVYTAGFVLPNDGGTRTLPASIEDVCLELVRAAYFAQAVDPNLVLDRSEGIGEVRYAPTGRAGSSGLTEAMRTTLLPYREMVWW